MRLYNVVASVVDLGESISQPSSPPPCPTSGFAARWAVPACVLVLMVSDLPTDTWIKSCPAPPGVWDLQCREGAGPPLQGWDGFQSQLLSLWPVPLLPSTEGERFLVSQQVCQGLGRQQGSLLTVLLLLEAQRYVAFSEESEPECTNTGAKCCRLDDAAILYWLIPPC